jgi:serine/threonine protein kinase
MTARDIFLSHSSGDAEVARELRAELEAAGYACWMAPDDVDGTDPWAEQILRAVQDCRAMLVLISSNANQSPHVSREVNLALGRKRAVLPIRIENVQPEASLEYLLSLVQRVDAFPPPIANHKDRILRRLSVIVPLRAGTLADPSTQRTSPSTAAIAQAATDAIETPAVVDASAATEMGSDARTDIAPPTDASPTDAETPLSPAPVGVGSRVGAFTIDDVIGEGGMATVYRATQDEPRRSVALKVIRADHAADDTYRNRFLAEKDTLASLEHPGIVPIYAAGEVDRVLFIAMRRIDGPDLAARLSKSGPMSLAETIVTLRPIADAIDYAHEMGVIHRDIKPSNIILDRGGRPYLTDFGLGKHLGEPRDLSAPGTTLGTLDYMAPEQFSGLTDPDLAGRTDVYALGCVAYACLTGAPPFRADEPQRLMYAHLHGAIPSLRDARPDLPAGVDAAVRQALAKNPADRFATADEFITALTAAQALATDRTAAVVVPPTAGRGSGLRALAPRGAGLGFAAVIAALVLAIGGGAMLLNSSGLLTADKGSASPGTDGTPAPTKAATAQPSEPASDPPTEPPTDPPSDPPTDPPTHPPTHPPQVIDTTPPTGISLTIKGTDLKTAKLVDLALTASGATQMRLGRASSATGTCTYESWRGFQRSVNSFDLKGGSDAGVRWICAEFRDAAQNTAGPTRDSVTFDNPPVINYSFDWNAYCDGTTTEHITVLEGGAPYVATDKDGVATLALVKAWATSPNNDAYVDFTSGLSTNGRTLNAWFGTGSKDWTIYYKVQDDYGVTRQGHFKVDCPPWT